MTSHAEVEASKTIARQAVTTTLKNNSLWLVVIHDSLDNWLEDGLVGGVIDAITKIIIYLSHIITLFMITLLPSLTSITIITLATDH